MTAAPTPVPSDLCRVGVIGMGYVGLTLTAALARRGFTVHGVDTSPTVLAALSAGRPHIFEPGIDEVFADLVGTGIFCAPELPAGAGGTQGPDGGPVDVAVISVSTPVNEETREPYLENLRAAARHVGERCHPETLVVVRSTVPVGTSRSIVLPELIDAWGRPPRLVMAPERTIQGQALRELVELPQVIGALDEESLALGRRFFGALASQLVEVSSLEAAELVKLANNCHTDLIYSYGNEIAMIAEGYGLDPLEVVRATNLDYPRPDLAKPGFVGGGCLTKDPYLLLRSAERAGYTPYLVDRARRLNEFLPGHVAGRVVELLGDEVAAGRLGAVSGSTVAVLGWAYKGWPPTDDMRGTPIDTMLPVFRAAGLKVVGHDPLVSTSVIREYAATPLTVAEAFAAADAVVVVTDHPSYKELDLPALLAAKAPGVIFDSWRILDAAAVTGAGVRYAGIGYAPGGGA